jgi:hypothetical protein
MVNPMTTRCPTEAALIARVTALLSEGYRISQEDAVGGLFAFALMFRPLDGSSVELTWESK